jgi:hypothetical protein
MSSVDLSSVPASEFLATAPSRGLAWKKAAWGVAGWLAFVLPFITLLAWFQVVDVYHLRFSEKERVNTSPAYLLYNGFRALYSLYLIWTLYFVGSVLLRSLEKKGARLGLRLADEVVLCFFAGAAIATAVGFVLGYLRLYYFWVLAPITLLLLGASYRSFGAFTLRALAWRKDIWARDGDVVDAVARRLAAAAVIFVAALLLALRALPPGGDHDYYTHYLPYFKHVVASHGVWPNDVWYHYYISKGATLVFWSAVLTDLQAPEVVTYAFVLVAGLAGFSVVRRWSGNGVLATAAAVAYLATLVCPRLRGDPDAWGGFQKHHEQTASLIASLAWLALSVPRCAGRDLWAWSLFAALFAAGTVLFAPTAYPLVVVLLGLGMLGWAAGRQWQMLKCFGGALAAATAVLASLLALNYWTTGLAEVTPMRLFWKHADQERFSKVWSPYLMVLLEEGSSPDIGKAALMWPAGMSRWQFAKSLIRYEHLSKFFFPREAWIIIWLLIGLSLIRGGRPRFGLARALLLILGFLAACPLLGSASAQHASAFRYFSFTLFFVNLFGALTWATIFELAPRPFFGKLARVVPAVFACLLALATLARIPTKELTDRLMFSLGRKSLASCYESGGGLHASAARATGNLPPGSRVYSFSFLYCTAPDREVVTFVSYALGRRWHEIMFEPPGRARDALQQQGLDYFLVDLNEEFMDIMQYSPLFSPENIAESLQVAWEEGDVYLLTWPGPGTRPLPGSFLARYRCILAQTALPALGASTVGLAGSPGQGPFLATSALVPGRASQTFDCAQMYERMRTIYEANKGKPYPVWRDPALPPVRGWQ